jgi:hypothetical protein
MSIWFSGLLPTTRLTGNPGAGGNQPKGERHNRAKLTEADVWEIRRRLAAGEVQRVIAAEFGVDPVSVSAIKTGKTWSYLK